MTNNVDSKQETINGYMENAYLDYSMYVIMDRALPHIADGLKPVQRRIVYAMNGLNLDHTAKHKKSARTVGDVLGKYHPHGDSACYEAMVMMAQPFSYREPLIDGQGNWGSTDDPKSFAAMRYTEAKLRPYAETLLSELSKDIVDYKPNFDGSLSEPVVLPARAPNILVNGTTGIAVGMATDIPPHNLNEVIKATKFCIDNEDATVSQIMKYIPAPDYPTGGIIVTNKTDIKKAYETGRGSIKVRARYEVNKNEVIITELPYQVSGNKVLEQIGSLVEAKKLNMVEDVQDESDKNTPIRLVIKIKKSSKLDPHTFMLHLFSLTDLEKNYRVNMNLIGLNGAPQVKPLNHIISEWIEFRRETTSRRFEARVKKIKARMHIIEGLIVAYLNIDEIIEIIRTEENPKDVMIERFNITEIQANAILDMKLRNLAKIEEVELNAEHSKLEEEKLNIEEILASKERMNDVMKEELNEVSKKYSTKRVSELNNGEVVEAKQLSESDLISAEAVSVVLSDKGWVRMGKGHNIDDQALNYKTGDKAAHLLRTKSNIPTVAMDQMGKMFTIKTHLLPSARGYGDHISKYVEPQSGVSFVGLIDAQEGGKWILASEEGYGLICDAGEMISAAKKGKQVLKTVGKTALKPIKIKDQENIAVITANGRLLIFGSDDLIELARGKGNKLIGLDKGDKVIQVIPLAANESLKINLSDKVVSYNPDRWSEFVSVRNRKGKNIPKYMKNFTISTDSNVEDDFLELEME